MSAVRHSREGGNLGKNKHVSLVVVFGGTFDPIHNGHIAIAKCLRDELDADSVVMVPTGCPWLRPDAPVATPEDRLRMVELAVENEKQIEVSDVDILRDKTTYSIDTIQDLRPRYGADCEFILAIGADAVPDLHQWHRYDQLIEECTFAIVERPGSPLEDTGLLPDGTLVIRGPMMSISASEIRRSHEQGAFHHTRQLVPQRTHSFMIEKGLYRRNQIQ